FEYLAEIGLPTPLTVLLVGLAAAALPPVAAAWRSRRAGAARGRWRSSTPDCRPASASAPDAGGRSVTNLSGWTSGAPCWWRRRGEGLWRRRWWRCRVAGSPLSTPKRPSIPLLHLPKWR